MEGFALVVAATVFIGVVGHLVGSRVDTSRTNGAAPTCGRSGATSVSASVWQPSSSSPG
jgi:hypothetical protein